MPVDFMLSIREKQLTLFLPNATAHMSVHLQSVADMDAAGDVWKHN
jgi:hypothetical protein